ncbi:MAG: iron-containing alcohol dehydrogenase [Gemmobacter sp.]
MSLIGYVTRIHFADRVLEDALPEELRTLGVHRPLVVTDAAGAADETLDRLADLLPTGFVQIAEVDTGTDPRVRAQVLARGADSGADAVIGLGGAAALDLARIIGKDVLPHAPVIALPTTPANVGLGPLAEGLAAATGCATGTACIPALILCDPTLTLAADPAATAADGMDALIHCLEAYLGTAWNPPADGIALDGLRRAAAHLERAVACGTDIEARREMLAAGLNAGLAAQKGLGGVHALAFALEAERSLRHGRLHAALLPPVMHFNAPAVADRLPPVRAALGLAPGGDVIAALAALGARIGLPGRLAQLHLDTPAMARVALRAAEGAASRTNPRHATAADYRRMLEAAL